MTTVLPVAPEGGPKDPSYAEPPPQWFPYRAWGLAPPELRTPWIRFVELLLGPQQWLLYLGISFRGGPTRWNEHDGFGVGRFHEPPKWWAPYVLTYEMDISRSFATRQEAEQHETRLINREQPLGCIAGRGRASDRGPRRPTTRRHAMPLTRRVLISRWSALAAVYLYLLMSLPRLVTGEFPGSWAELGAWAATVAAALAGLRFAATRHWMAAKKERS